MTVEFENVSAPALRWLARGERFVRDGEHCGSARIGYARSASCPTRDPPRSLAAGPHAAELDKAIRELGLPLDTQDGCIGL